jgi:hypothetical protein
MNKPLDRALFFTLLRQQWYPPARGRKDAFADHARELADLFEQMRGDPRLDYLDSQFYPEWRQLGVGGTIIPPADSDEFRRGFYLCNRLIQLMECVYLDLNLEGDHAHPDNRGWMNLFRHWSWSPMFRLVWLLSISTYGVRFQTFCEAAFALSCGHVEILSQPFDLRALGSADGNRLLAGPHFNNRERQLIGRFVKTNGKLIEDPWFTGFRLHLFKIGLDFGAVTGRYDFQVGFCLTGTGGGQEYLLYGRVRDHVRNMGLYRRALRHANLAGVRLELPAELPRLEIPSESDDG